MDRAKRPNANRRLEYDGNPRYRRRAGVCIKQTKKNRNFPITRGQTDSSPRTGPCVRGRGDEITRATSERLFFFFFFNVICRRQIIIIIIVNVPVVYRVCDVILSAFSLAAEHQHRRRAPASSVFRLSRGH